MTISLNLSAKFESSFYLLFKEDSSYAKLFLWSDSNLSAPFTYYFSFILFSVYLAIWKSRSYIVFKSIFDFSYPWCWFNRFSLLSSSRFFSRILFCSAISGFCFLNNYFSDYNWVVFSVIVFYFFSSKSLCNLYSLLYFVFLRAIWFAVEAVLYIIEAILLENLR